MFVNGKAHELPLTNWKCTVVTHIVIWQGVSYSFHSPLSLLSPFLLLIQFGWSYAFRLRGTTAGANNRMDILSLVTSKVDSNGVSGPEEDIIGEVEDWQEDEISRTSHKRGLAPFAFVPFEEVLIAFSSSYLLLLLPWCNCIKK